MSISTTRSTKSISRPLATACTILVGLVVLQLPLFLAQPLTGDNVLYDLAAKNVREGRPLYRDLFDSNLPGVVWIHTGVRTLFGDGSAALRLFDFGLLAATVVLLSRQVFRITSQAKTAIWCATVLLLFYFSLSIWCHAQRDGWMLFFALVGLEFRWRQLKRLKQDNHVIDVFAWSLLEGFVWGCGFWIKPFILVPAALCFATGVLLIGFRRTLVDLCGVLCGGLLCGLAGSAWLVQTGAWPYFVDTIFHWSPDHFQARSSPLAPRRLLALAVQLQPWFLIHVAALPLAAWTVLRSRVKVASDRQVESPHPSALPLLCAMYLGFMIESAFLQAPHAYVHVPGILIGLSVLAALRLVETTRLGRPTLIVFLLFALLTGPAFSWKRIRHWPQCIRGSTTAQIQNDVRGPLDRAYPAGPDMVDLGRVATYLRSQGVKDGEVTCYSYSVMHLYWMLDIKPSCKFPCPRIYALRYFTDHQDEIRRAIENSPEKYVVTDLILAGVDEATATAETLPPSLNSAIGEDEVGHVLYPWSYPIVFRAGRYQVRRVEGPMGVFSKFPRPELSSVDNSAEVRRVWFPNMLPDASARTPLSRVPR